MVDSIHVNDTTRAGSASPLEHLSLAVEAAQIGIYEWYPATDTAVWSAIMRRLHGVDPDEKLTLASALASIHREDCQRVKDAIQAALDPAGDGKFEVEYRTSRGGQVRWLASIGRARFEERQGRRVPMRLAGVALDVTHRKQLEAALRDEGHRKDEFLALLGHELRNPLAPLRTACEIMRCEGLEPHQLRALQEMIGRQVGHLSRLVDDMLDTARIGQGKLSLTRTAVELKPLLEATVESARSFTEPRRHRVELVAADEPLWVDGDPVRLTQIVINLLHNAAKFSDDGGHIRVSLERDAGEAVIRVSDEGKGMPAELLPRLFQLFSQGEARRHREEGGLGLGLALVRNLSRMHGGTVAASSPGPGKGSEFVVRLPLVAAPSTSPAPASAEAPGNSRRVLVVDDNRDAAESLAMLLEMSGHSVEAVGDGEAALSRVETWRPEFMLVDIGLPGIDGYEVARRLRARPSSRGIFLAAFTGYSSVEDRQRSLDAGFDYHLVKPVAPEELLRLLRQLPKPIAGVGAPTGTPAAERRSRERCRAP